jgi:hypothetical protein
VTGPSPAHPVACRVYIAGHDVGWSITYRQGSSDIELDGYRNAQAMTPTVVVNQPLVGLSSAGAVLASSDPLVHDESAGGDTGITAAFSLRTYAGRTVQLLADQHVVEVPQVDGSTMAWIDEHGVLKVAPVDVTPAAPAYLGDSLRTHPTLTVGRSTFRLHVPYSAVLTKCSVQVRRLGAVVRTLSCSSARMKVGVAAVSWNGRTGGHAVTRGQYRYVVTASGAGGSGTRVTGTIRVT